MQLKVFTLRLDPETGAFDDTAVQAFLTERTVLSVAEHFFIDAGHPVWALLVTWRDEARLRHSARPPNAAAREAAAGAQVAASGDRAGRGIAPIEALRAELAPEELPLFDALRAWRSATAQAEGKAAYVVLSNRSLVTLVQRRPTSLTALAEVPGIGEARVRDHGTSLLAILEAHRVDAAPPPATPSAPGADEAAAPLPDPPADG